MNFHFPASGGETSVTGGHFLTIWRRDFVAGNLSCGQSRKHMLVAEACVRGRAEACMRHAGAPPPLRHHAADMHDDACSAPPQ